MEEKEHDKRSNGIKKTQNSGNNTYRPEIIIKLIQALKKNCVHKEENLRHRYEIKLSGYKGTLKQSWKYAQSRLKTKTTIMVKTLGRHNCHFTRIEEKAKLLNDFFH